MKVRNILMATVVGAAALFALPSTAQAADHGDGKAACNSTEICFQWIWDGFTTQTSQRHFYGSDSYHGDDNFSQPYGGAPLITLLANAEGIYNRDSSCTVTLYMSRSYATAYASVARGTKQSISPWNASHKRCA
jgi:hypothetical protein